MPWGMVIGGALSYLGSQDAASSYSSAADKAAANSKFTPYNVYSGYGSGTFTPASAGTPGTGGYWSGGTNGYSGGDSRGTGGGSGVGRWVPGSPGTPGHAASATASLNPQYQGLRDQYLQQANGNLGAFSSYDPASASADIYGKLSALSAPQEQLDRQNLENRLLAQGMLGSTGGGLQQKALFDSQGNTRLAREIQSYSTAQDTLDRMQGRAINATNAASGMDSLALQNLNLGGAFGGKAMQGNQFGAGLQYQAGVRGGDASAQFWAGLGQQVAPAINNYYKSGNGSYNDTGMFGLGNSQYVPKYGGSAYGGSSGYAP